MRIPLQGAMNIDIVEQMVLTAPEQCEHFGLKWEDHGWLLMCLENRIDRSHATMILPLLDPENSIEPDEDGIRRLDGEAGFREGWPAEWPEHNWSDCHGHGDN